MADTNLLAQLLAGGPLAPMQVGGYHGAQLQDAALNPAFAHNQGPFGALAKTIAGFAGPPMLQRAAEQATAARMGANPELARMLASNDPFGMAGAQGANPIAAAQILAGATPSSAAEAALNRAQAGFTGEKLKDAVAAGSPGERKPLYKPSAGAPSAAAPAPAPLSLGTGYADPVSEVLKMPAGSPQQAAAYGRLSKAQKAALAAKVKAQTGGVR